MHTLRCLFCALLLGFSLQVLERTKVRAVAYAASILCLTLTGVGLRQNLSEMRATGERSLAWHRSVENELRRLPDGSIVLVRPLGPTKQQSDYSLIRLTTPQKLILTGKRPAALRFVTGDRLLCVWQQHAHEPELRHVLSNAGVDSEQFVLELGPDEFHASVTYVASYTYTDAD